jgi:hypothetical protein
MQFASARSNHATHMKALVKKRPSLSFGSFICFLLTDEELNLLGKKAADRRFSTSGQNLGLLENLPTQAYRDVLFSVIS